MSPPPGQGRQNAAQRGKKRSGVEPAERRVCGSEVCVEPKTASVLSDVLSEVFMSGDWGRWGRAGHLMASLAVVVVDF